MPEKTKLDAEPKLSKEETDDLVSELSSKHEEITALKAQLTKLNQAKEAAFDKREQLSKSISQHITHIKTSKVERDKNTGNVKQIKAKRDSFNKIVREKQKELAPLEKEKEDLVIKHKIKGNPQILKKEIQKLEYSLETNVVGFEKEKELNKHIKQLKKQLGDSDVVNVVVEKITVLRKEVRDARTEAQKLHKQVMEIASASQKKHESIVGESKEIDTIKDTEKNANDEFLKRKKAYQEINDQVKKKFDEIHDINKKLGRIKKEEEMVQKDKDNEILKSKEEIVQEKIKTGGKLTTEDLLVMQKVMKD
jgi:uncharacterized coiled-coil DUF342 family protein